MGLEQIKSCIRCQDVGRLVYEIKQTRWNKNVVRYLSSALDGADLSPRKKMELASKIDRDPELKARVDVTIKEVEGERLPIFEVKSPKSFNVGSLKKASVAIIILGAVFFCYTTFVQDHPMEALGLDCDESCAYAGVPFVIEAEISPHNTTCRLLAWDSNLEDVTITVVGDSATVLLGPTAAEGDTLKITATSERYGLKQTISIPIKNEIEVVLDCPGTDVWPGDELEIRGIAKPGPSIPEFQWNVDKKWVELTSDGDTARIQVDYGVRTGDVFTVMGKIPGTDIRGYTQFTIVEGLSVKLSTAATTVEAGSSFEVNASIRPAMPPGSSLQWSVVGKDVTYTSDGTSLTGWLSPDADNGATIVVSASVSGYGVGAQETLTGINPSRIPIEVSDIAGLMDMKAERTYNILCDIDLTGVSWIPYDFEGVLNGNGHTISGLNIDVIRPDSGTCLTGLFKTNRGEVRNLNLTNSRIYFEPNHAGSGPIYAGIVAGFNEGTIDRCSVFDSEVSIHRDDSSSGGIAGYSTGTVSNSSVTGLIMFGNGDMGGIAGSVKGGEMIGCMTKDSNIKHYAVYNQRSIGGIAGFANTGSTVSGCGVDGTDFYLDGDLSLKVHMGYVIGSLTGSTARMMSSNSVTQSYTGTMKNSGSWFFGVGGYDYSTFYFANHGGNIGCISGSSSVS